MARPAGDKTRCNGQWTEARYRSFVKSALRSATVRWAPIQECKKQARVSRGLYECAECKQHVPPTVRDEAKRQRTNNIFVDHISPIIDPETGFVSWDVTIERMFCEMENLALLCKSCHDTKSQAERDVATQRRQKEKTDG